ncbi:esterase family protein [Aspergillus niger]|uniref:Esterase family protein n=1 Tax=Aspergillus niger TaxID=5061 RepID=A0A117DZJ0_ASPNG|nr:esterase family protein [Aspergillus niger]
MFWLIFLLVILVTGSPDINTPPHDPPSSDLPITDLTFVRKWAAIGDSYTAGIGAGDLWSDKKEDTKCSRYDKSYVALLKHMLGPQVTNFTYTACSGARTSDIYSQAQDLDKFHDLIVLTGGGNDLCLSDIITTCIFLPFNSEEKCQKVIELAQENIKFILGYNVRRILEVAVSKVNAFGIIVWALYGQFFNTETDDCEKNQDWAFPGLAPFDALPLTRERREKLNQLVTDTNKVIKKTIEDFVMDKGKYFPRVHIRTADWNDFMKDGLKGQYCVPESTGKYPDPMQPNLHFFKPDTTYERHTELKAKRDNITDTSFSSSADTNDTLSSFYDSILYRSPNPAAAALYELNPTGVTLPPGCPGDKGIGFGLPDRWGKYFHPNELGHKTIASFVLDGIYAARADFLGKRNPICSRGFEEFRCWQNDGRRDYASADLLNKNYKTYCKEVKPPKKTANWKDERWFHQQTPETHSFSIQLSDGATHFDQGHCLESFERIINSCDGNDPKNPMNWKFGGRWTRGSYTYEVNIANSFQRPWPPTREVGGFCDSSYKFWYQRYDMRGRGWATWDAGQDTLKPAIISCVGHGLTGWDFQYLDHPDSDGNEWVVKFNTPILTGPRCFDNNRVQFNAGGFTRGCHGVLRRDP